MAKNSILITGSQRSGTTLLHLILDSHPEIVGIDEENFIESQLSDYPEDKNTPACVSFKLPNYVHRFDRVKTWPNLKVLFCIRDPKDVVSSMMSISRTNTLFPALRRQRPEVRILSGAPSIFERPLYPRKRTLGKPLAEGPLSTQSGHSQLTVIVELHLNLIQVLH